MGTRRMMIASLAVLLAAGAAAALYLASPEAKAGRAEEKEKGKAADDEAAVRRTAADFAKAFGKGDAKAVSALWTAKGEYIGPDGETLHGRTEIEKSYTEFFAKHPKATAEVEVGSVKLLGLHTAMEEGTVRITLPGEDAPSVARYSVLHVREGDSWKMASVREWVPDPSELVSLKDVAWLVGEWSAKGKDGEVSVSYAWDEDKMSIKARYTVKRDGKVVSSGTQMIRKDPAGGLRSWQFDSNGGHGESAWTREGSSWVIEAAGVAPDGSEVTAVNLLVPLGKDGFTWQSAERTAAGSDLPGIPPVKVTRVKDKK